jgi:GntR family transcriptional repressor for pyruvate dehydrogenase complex
MAGARGAAGAGCPAGLTGAGLADGGSSWRPVLPVPAQAGEGGAARSLGGPLRRRTTAGQVVDRLVTAIALGSYLPGEKLPPQREFASRLGVSRATLRDAVQQLTAMGLVTTRLGRNGGAVVTSAWAPGSEERIRGVLAERWQDFERLFDLMREINPLISRLAAQRRTRADIRRIHAAARAYAEAASEAGAQQADHDIHAAVAQATHNIYFVSLDRQLRAQLSFGTDALPYSEPIRQRAVREHLAIAAAVEAGQAGLADKLTRRHFVELVERPLRELHLRVRAGEPRADGQGQRLT